MRGEDGQPVASERHDDATTYPEPGPAVSLNGRSPVRSREEDAMKDDEYLPQPSPDLKPISPRTKEKLLRDIAALDQQFRVRKRRARILGIVVTLIVLGLIAGYFATRGASRPVSPPAATGRP